MYDIIPGDETIPPEGVWVKRRMAVSDYVIPLDNLEPSDPLVQALTWTNVDMDPQLLLPGSQLVVEIPAADKRAALVEYTVQMSGEGTPYLTALSQASLYESSSVPWHVPVRGETTWGRIRSLFR